jgi:hypothetical protein
MSSRPLASPEARASSAPIDLLAKFDPLIAQRQALLDTGVKDPFSLVMEQVLSPTRAIVNGRETILLGTYNYMGMTFDPDVITAGKTALDEFGSGTTGSRVLNGTYQGHKECEQALREFYGMDHAMVFSTGYQANLGIISTIAGKDDYIVLDIDSHASIYDGCAMGDAQIVPFRHNDVTALEKRLARIPATAGKLVVLEGVYSMLGDVAPLKEMITVSKAAGATVLVDDLEQGIAVADAYAAEHLEVQTQDAAGVAGRIRNAGAVFVGPWSPVSLGDYAAGSNHVLPTGGCARHSSGLSVQTFLRGIHVIEYDESALRDVAGPVEVLADAEDLPAHRAAVRATFPR